MNNKFEYGYDVEKYIDNALDKLKETYPWAIREMFRKEYTYSIEKEKDKYEFVSYYKWYDGKIDRKVIENTEDFINEIISNQRSYIEDANEVKDVYKVPIEPGTIISGWYLERYEFRSHELGGYSALVQAGDRVTGGTRTFFIPPKFFEGTYDEFLDKYIELVPGYFGMGKQDLIQNKELKKFLGFKR